ncbi:MAG: flavodoxin family protein [Candidatus Bathyarchaeota archaeon]|nr:flavodoxin family protein [Candidatus Bathyarchaeota archaeon]MDH5687850.1 flavodoxin family protein [Candidatus Bathyarchaeota archaeon]
MRAVGICASHRRGGSSFRLLEEAMKGIKEVNPKAETKIIELARLNIGPCIATCAYVDPVTCARQPFQCNVKDDLQVVFEEMKQADTVLIASPYYFLAPSKLAALMERLYCVHYFTKHKHPTVAFPAAGKPFGLLAVSGTGGHYNLSLLEHLKRFCLYLQMKPVTTETSPYIGVSGEDPVEKDSKALEHAKTLGQTIAKLAR